MKESPGPKRKLVRKPPTSEVGEPVAAPKPDTLLIHGVSEDGDKLAVLRARDDKVEAGIVSRAKEGQPLHGELIKLTPRPDFPLLCDVEVELPAPHRQPAAEAREKSRPQLRHGGPAQVATETYRANWDAIFSRKKPSQLN